MPLQKSTHEAWACAHQDRAPNSCDPFLVMGKQFFRPRWLRLTIVVKKRYDWSSGGPHTGVPGGREPAINWMPDKGDTMLAGDIARGVSRAVIYYNYFQARTGILPGQGPQASIYSCRTIERAYDHAEVSRHKSHPPQRRPGPESRYYYRR